MIHPTAIIDPSAKLHASVEVGPYSIVGADVEIGEGSWIGPHVVLTGPMKIGKGNKIYQFASIGELSQDLTATRDQPTSTVIGDNNVIREYVTIQRGTMKEAETKKGETRIGDRNLIMAYCHVAHDCWIGNGNIFANNTSLAGHVHIGNTVVMGGFTLIYQFMKIGDHAFTAYCSAITGDVPPFVTVSGSPAEPRIVNKEGLKRRDFSAEEIDKIEDAFKLIYRSGKVMAEVKAELAEMAKDSVHVQQMLDFINTSRRLAR
ncbi:MAG: acyl-ACP--UDP-N-acetylglucosamine O-acyltransferase [Rhizobium sp.]|nr:MAG: acyl-ACP--UDP-N-acetylglucosamine O-acyltransferase [Rhizobium sp.]